MSVVCQERIEIFLNEPNTRKKLTKSATELLNYMQSFPADEPIQATQNELAKALNSSRMTISRALEQLEKAGYIDIISGKEEGESNTYFLKASASLPVIKKSFDLKEEIIKKQITYLEDNSGNITVLSVRKPMLPILQTTQPVGSFLFPVDKVNCSIWDNRDDISKTEITIPLKAEPDNSKRQVTNTVMLCLDELKDNSAIQRLTQYDLRVYMAIGNLYNAGNSKISIRDIYKTMGNNNNPAPNQRKKILLSIEKMSSIRITIDTTEEEQAGYRYPNLHIKRRNLLYTKVDVAFKRGQETEVIVLMEEPVLFQFALARNQYTTVPATLLCSPLSKTEATLAIENYLLKRITERGKNDGTILLSTVYEKAGIQTKQQRYKAKEKIKNLLDYYKEQGFISDYDICMNDNKAKTEECIKIKKK